MPWQTMEVREQRVRFVVTAFGGERSLSRLCREFGEIPSQLSSGGTGLDFMGFGEG